MLSGVTLLLAASVSGTSDRIYADSFEEQGACPAGRITVSDVFYPPSQSNVRHSVDLTAFEAVWGYLSYLDPVPELWPGAQGASPVIESFSRNGYLAAEFHTPISMPAVATGTYKSVSYFAGPNLTATISRSCGDFSQVEPGCFATDIPPSDDVLLRWRGGAGNSFYCGLDPDTTYYFNLKLTDPDAIGSNCNSNACWVHVLRQ
jgi:hypothetical protein